MTDDEALGMIPQEMIGGFAVLADSVLALAVLKGATRADAENIISCLPDMIKAAPCFLDRLTARWRYVFGSPLTGLPNEQVAVGTHMFHDVYRLFGVVSCARTRLTAAEWSKYSRALGIKEKHEDALVEFAPILRLDRSVNVAYEIAGANGATIDWRIDGASDKPILLEVKNRTRDLLEGLQQGPVGGANIAPEPLHNADLLFRSIEKKFEATGCGKTIHAVWIRTGYRQEETELLEAFGRLDPERVQVAVLGDWGDDAVILANNEAAKKSVLRVFRLTESRRFLFRRGAPVG